MVEAATTSTWQKLATVSNRNLTYTLYISTGDYEVLPTEPLHDIKEHIANVLTELPPHLEKEEKNALEQIKEYALGGKKKLRGCDYRLGAVVVAQYLRGKNCMHTHETISLAKLLSNLKFADPYISFVGKVRPKVQTLLDSLTELSRLLYLPEQSRCPKSVLRLHNQAFVHAMVCKEIIIIIF